MEITPQGIIAVIQSGGVVGLLVLLIWGGARRWWVFGWQYDDVKTERDRWHDLATASTNQAERAVDIAAIIRELEKREHR